MESLCYPHFKDKETEVQRSDIYRLGQTAVCDSQEQFFNLSSLLTCPFAFQIIWALQAVTSGTVPAPYCPAWGQPRARALNCGEEGCRQGRKSICLGVEGLLRVDLPHVTVWLWEPLTFQNLIFSFRNGHGHPCREACIR